MVSSEQKIESPNFGLYRPLGNWGRQLVAENAFYLPPDGDRRGGYLLDKVEVPDDLSKLANASVDDEPVLLGPRETSWLKEDQVFVYYGFIDRLGVTHKFSTESPDFDEGNLEFHFTDCGEYGFVLSRLIYDGNESETVSRGSAAVHVLEVKFI